MVPPKIGPFGGNSNGGREGGGEGLWMNFEEGDNNDFGVNCACIVEKIIS